MLKSIAKKNNKKRYGSLPPPGQSDFARLVHGRKLADTKRDPCLMQFRSEFLMPDEHRSVRGPSFTPFFIAPVLCSSGRCARAATFFSRTVCSLNGDRARGRRSRLIQARATTEHTHMHTMSTPDGALMISCFRWQTADLSFYNS